MTDQIRLRVGIVVTAQFTLNALANFTDVLRLAGDDGDRSRPIRGQWHVMSTSGAVLRASCGVQLTPTSGFINFTELDYIAVVGGLLYRGRQIDEETRSYLLAADKAGVGLLGICTGSFVLCRLGLMEGKKCCISWYHYRDFLEEFDGMVPVADQLCVVDGARITSSGGVGAALAAAHLVERHLDAASAQKALHIMQIDGSRMATGLQPAPPMMWSCDDDRVTRTLIAMEQNVNKPIPVEELASRLVISRRTLERLFERHMGFSPGTAYLRLRLNHARWMLRSGGMSLSLIAKATGFSCNAHFSAAFKQVYGWSPSEERRRGSGNPKRGVAYERVSRVFDLG